MGYKSVDVVSILREYEQLGLKLVRYTGNKVPKNPKQPVDKGFTKPDYQPPSIPDCVGWIAHGGWVGVVVPPGVLVLDIDHDPDAVQWVEKVYLTRPDCGPVQKTANGYHLWFKAQAGYPGDTATATLGGFQVTPRRAERNCVLVEPSEGKKWVRPLAPLERLPPVPWELQPAAPKNEVGDWQAVVDAVAAARPSLPGAGNDLDLALAGACLASGRLEADFLRACEKIWGTDYDEAQALRVWEATEQRRAAGLPIRGFGALRELVPGIPSYQKPSASKPVDIDEPPATQRKALEIARVVAQRLGEVYRLSPSPRGGDRTPPEFGLRQTNGAIVRLDGDVILRAIRDATGTPPGSKLVKDVEWYLATAFSVPPSSVEHRAICTNGQIDFEARRFIPVDALPAGATALFEFLRNYIPGQLPSLNILRIYPILARFGVPIEAIVELIARALLPYPTGEFTFLLGPGGDGKSTFLNMLSLFIHERHMVRATAQEFSAERELRGKARLRGALACIIDDASYTGWGYSFLKEIATARSVAGAAVYQETSEFLNTAHIFMAANRQPKRDDHSKGFFDRLNFVPFFSCLRGTDAALPDPLAELRKYPEELDVVFSCAVNAAFRFLKTRKWDFKHPADPQAISDALASPEATFFLEQLTYDPNEKQNWAELEKAFYAIHQKTPRRDRLEDLIKACAPFGSVVSVEQWGVRGVRFRRPTSVRCVGWSQQDETQELGVVTGPVPPPAQAAEPARDPDPESVFPQVVQTAQQGFVEIKGQLFEVRHTGREFTLSQFKNRRGFQTTEDARRYLDAKLAAHTAREVSDGVFEELDLIPVLPTAEYEEDQDDLFASNRQKGG